MKKLISVILALALLPFMPIAVFAADLNSAVSVTITAGQSYTNEVTVSEKKVVDAFAAALDSSTKSTAKTSGIKTVVQLTFKFADGKSELRTISRDEGGDLYVTEGSKVREIDAAGFYAIFTRAEIYGHIYKFDEIPAVTASSRQLGVVSSTYSFEMLDGKFYKSTFTKSDGPTLSLANGKLPVPAFPMRPKDVKVSVFEKGSTKSLWSGAIKDMDSFKPEKSGKYRVEFKATYAQPHAKGDVVYAYNISYSTGISFTMAGSSTNPGEIVVLRAKNVPSDEKIAIKTGISYKPQFFKEASSGDMVALLPVSYYTAPGTYSIEFTCGTYSKKASITVADKKFSVQYLTVAAETAEQTINSKKADDEYEKYMVPVRKIADDKQHWQGQFIWPLTGNPRVTTAFGAIRYINGGKTPSRHGAIDFAAAAGTPVYASNSGRIVYSGYLQLTGNTIVIEHGYGLKTWYYHMNGLNVKNGAMVKKGQQIGIVGSTGFSTGAHLHFGMSVSNAASGNQYMNPTTAISSNLLSDFANT